MEEVIKKGLNKENIQRLFKFEGWKKELPWILLIIVIAFAVYGYQSDTKTCQDMVQNKCYQQCRLEEFQKQMELDNPGIKVNCFINNITQEYKCDFAGVKGEGLPYYDKIKDTINDINKIKLIPNGT